MNRVKAGRIRWYTGGFFLVSATLWWLAQRVEFRYSDGEILHHFTTENVSPRIHRYHVDGHHIRYVEFGADTLPVTILVHGAPSSLSFFSRFYEDTAVLNRSMLVGVDRPGYGYSDFGRAITSIKEQARLLQPLIDRYTRNGKKVVLAASSYGGPVAAKVAMNNPDKISGLLFVSSALAPGHEYIIPFISAAIDSPYFRWIFPTILQVANDEKLGHRKALEEIQEGWASISSKVILIHGREDGLVYFSNAEYARKKLVNAKSVELVPVAGIGHSMMFDRPELIRERIIELVTGEGSLPAQISLNRE